jgi:hypothetical protein
MPTDIEKKAEDVSVAEEGSDSKKKEKGEKKRTANSVIKEFNLTPDELHELLTQIYETLEKETASE